MGLPVQMKFLFLMVLVSLFVLAGCTQQETDQAVNIALQQGVHDQIKNLTGLNVNTSGINFTPLIQAGENRSGGAARGASCDVDSDCASGVCQNSVCASMAGGGSCRFDTDCPPSCDGNVYWKYGCDSTHTCVKTFDYDCTATPTTVGDFSFPKVCTSTGCVDDTASIHAKKEDLISQANQYSAAMQQTTSLRQIASKNCISALADVTNRLIVETALSMASPTTKTVELWTDTTKQAVETLGTANSDKMSAEEFISLNCNAVKALDSDFALLSKKRDIAMAQANQFQGQ